MQRRVLHIEDSAADTLLARRHLEEASTPDETWRPESFGALGPALDRLGKGDIDVVLLDLDLPDSAGLETLERLRERDPGVPVVVLTSTRDEEIGIRSVEFGAQDHLVKSEVAGARALVRSLRHAIERARTASLHAALASRVSEAQRMESLGVVAASAGSAYDRILERILHEVDACFDSKWRLSAALRGRLHRIRRAALDGERLGERLRSYAAVRHATRRPTNLSEFVLDAFELLDPLVGAPVELDVTLAEELPPVAIDPVLLRQLLVALVLNAMEAIGRGSRGRVRIQTGIETLAPDDLAHLHGNAGLHPGPYVSLCVEDTGSGLPPTPPERFFDPFTTSRDGGSGLGLSAALGIARQHGGAIRIGPARPVGTAVCVLLPGVANAPWSESTA